MDKTAYLKEIYQALKQQHQLACRSVAQAHDAATHEENVAENKYDTLGLEAAYLAHGLAVRETQCKEDLLAFIALRDAIGTELHDLIKLGSFIQLLDEQGSEQMLFLGPSSGGLKVNTSTGYSFMVVTPATPFGQALMGCRSGDEVEVVIAGEKVLYEVLSIA